MSEPTEPGVGPAPSGRPVSRLLVVMPTWLGDCVMATPTLRALRGLYPQAHIAALVSDVMLPALDACPWLNELIPWDRKATRSLAGLWRKARELKRYGFDAAVLLPNSLRSAAIVRLAGIPSRIGYARDGRGWLLADRLQPLRKDGKHVPVSTLQYYLDIARHLGATDPSPSMELFTQADDDERAARLLTGDTPGSGLDERRPIVLLTPGANFGDAKLWLTDRFAAVADRLHDECGVTVAISGAPGERAILDEVLAAAKSPIIDLAARGIDLKLLKSVVKQCHLVVTNDTGPRHLAAAMGVPVVTVFGPTDPAWTVIDFADERQVMVDVECGPCQQKKCPLSGTADFHQCMTGVSVDMVVDRCVELLSADSRP